MAVVQQLCFAEIKLLVFLSVNRPFPEFDIEKYIRFVVISSICLPPWA